MTRTDLYVETCVIHRVGAPIHVYPMYENGFRAHRGQSIEDNQEESARLYAEFAKTAEKNPVAWSYGKPAETQKYIGTISKRNRLICYPCECLVSTVPILGQKYLLTLI